MIQLIVHLLFGCACCFYFVLGVSWMDDHGLLPPEPYWWFGYGILIVVFSCAIIVSMRATSQTFRLFRCWVILAMVPLFAGMIISSQLGHLLGDHSGNMTPGEQRNHNLVMALYTTISGFLVIWIGRKIVGQKPVKNGNLT